MLPRSGMSDDTWDQITTPSWDFWYCIYRVKPTPKEVWINVYHDESVAAVAYPSESLARDAMLMAGVPTLFREVIKEEERQQKSLK